MGLSFARHERIILKGYPGLSESWLHDMICRDTSILGLGDVDVVARERVQCTGGRLDLMLMDTESSIRYEVEIMLGATDPSHIIRCIEYWDIERRRYPAYDHVAVLIAEELTTRFLNVIGLLSGSIPLIAIQLNALRIQDQIILDFVKVLDQRMLREDDEAESAGIAVDRNWWESQKGKDSISLCDKLLELANEKSSAKYQLKFKRSHVALSTDGSFFNLAIIWPKQKFIRFRSKVQAPDSWVKEFETSGLEAESRNDGRVQVRITHADFQRHEALLRSFIQRAIEDSSS
ncbi:MAG: hypothetical protein U1D30_00110 [Planctomycetota bacterium]